MSQIKLFLCIFFTHLPMIPPPLPGPLPHSLVLLNRPPLAPSSSSPSDHTYVGDLLNYIPKVAPLLTLGLSGVPEILNLKSLHICRLHLCGQESNCLPWKEANVPRNGKQRLNKSKRINGWGDVEVLVRAHEVELKQQF